MNARGLWREQNADYVRVREDTGCTCVTDPVAGGSGLVGLGLLGLLVLRRRRR